jgi:4-amino-4-deoxy-L-arabinose transferase-like glycosyltransferase
VVIVLAFHLACGLTLALLARERVRADGPLASPVFPLVLLHAAAVVLPTVTYLYAVHPAWSALYAVDPVAVPGLAAVPLVALHLAALLGGYVAAGRQLRAGRVRVVAGAAGAAWLLAVTLAVALRARLGVAAGYDAFHAGRGRGLLEVELGWALVVTALFTFGSLGYAALEVRRDARRLRPR